MSTTRDSALAGATGVRVLAYACLLLATGVLAACQSGEGRSGAASPAKTQSAEVSAVTELIKEDLVVGTGDVLASGKFASVHYTGWLYASDKPEHKGKQFDSSLTRGVPFKFPVGARRVIAGWDQGVVGMQVGGQRRLTIPAVLGYGANGAGGVIPPHATLVFDVELLAIE